MVLTIKERTTDELMKEVESDDEKVRVEAANELIARGSQDVDILRAAIPERCEHDRSLSGTCAACWEQDRKNYIEHLNKLEPTEKNFQDVVFDSVHLFVERDELADTCKVSLGTIDRWLHADVVPGEGVRKMVFDKIVELINKELEE